MGQHLPHEPDLPRECFWRIRAKTAVLAAGALERPIVFPMNDRPGIMLASAVRSYLNRYGVAPGSEPDAVRHERRRAPHGGGDAGGGPARGRRHRQPDRRRETGRLPADRGRAGHRHQGPPWPARDHRAPWRADRGYHHRLPHHVGRLEPFGAPDLSPRRATCLGCRGQGLPARTERGAGHDPGGRVQRGDVDRRLPDAGQGGRHRGAEDAWAEAPAHHRAESLGRGGERQHALVCRRQGPRMARLRQ